MADRAAPGAPRGRPDPLIGTVVAGRFRIEARIASGGMGTVYRAEQLGLDRKVALKLLHADALEGTEDSEANDDLAVLEKRFSREAAILAKLSHPNVVTVFDYGRIDDAEAWARPRFYMVMELLGGETLQDRLQKRRSLTIDETLHLGRQIARGLREAHALGVVHRDLKPANVMIVRDRDGEEIAKLLDFGIGKVLDRDSLQSTADPEAELTQEGRFVGSPMYMSPEQIAHGHVDARTDVYTLGVVLYRCLAGVHPFHRDNTTLVMLAHLHDKPIPLRERVPEVPAWLGDLVDRCMQKDPAHRPATMDEVYRALTEQSPSSPHPHPTQAPSRAQLAPFVSLPASEEGPTIASGTHSYPLRVPPTDTSPQALAAMGTGSFDRGASTGSTLDSAAPRRRAMWPVFTVAGVLVAGVIVVLLTRTPPPESANGAAPTQAAPSASTPVPKPSLGAEPLDLEEVAAQPSSSASASAPAPTKPTATKPVAKPPGKPTTSTPAPSPPTDIILKR
ncbi:MAG: protein kinase [Deltaproteobacteria bacterium]|nr:protein kinase [Deltaproteobacteria bacterium]